MITSLTIENFRLLKHLVLEDLGRINLITGKNNTGKTSVLEAIILLQGAGNIPLRFTIEGGRGIEQVNTTRESIADVWESLFREFNIKTPILLTQVLNDVRSELKIEIQ